MTAKTDTMTQLTPLHDALKAHRGAIITVVRLTGAARSTVEGVLKGRWPNTPTSAKITRVALEVLDSRQRELRELREAMAEAGLT